MARKKLSTDWPVFNLKTFKSIPEAFSVVRNIVNSIIQLQKRLVIVIEDHANHMDGSSQAGAPTSTPTEIFQLNLDTTAKDAYISVGTSSSADWKKITP